MGDIKITFRGQVELSAVLMKKASLEEVKKTVMKHGAGLERQAKLHANFRGHYEGNKFIHPTGNLKRNIKLGFRDGGLTAVVQPQADYSAYVEFGTRFMSAQPYLKPAFNIVKTQFFSDLQKLTR